MGKRGKISIREKMETHLGENLFDLFQSDCPTPEEACKAINSYPNLEGSGLEMKPQTLLLTIKRAIQANELEEDAFAKWFEKKPRGRKGRETETTPGKVFTPKFSRHEDGLRLCISVPYNNQDGERVTGDFIFEVRGNNVTAHIDTEELVEA